MCGLFAYLGEQPHPNLIEASAHLAGRRGPHAHGWAGPHTTHHRAPGPLDPATASAKITSTALGHARMATTGSIHDPDAIQPIHAHGHLIAYNGTITNAEDLHPEPAASDAVRLARAYAHRRALHDPPREALAWVLERAEHISWALLVLDAEGVMLAHRNQLPLWGYVDSSGTYLSSGRIHTDARPVPEGRILSC